MPPPPRCVSVFSDDYSLDEAPQVPTPSSTSEDSHGQKAKGTSKSQAPRPRFSYATSTLQINIESLQQVLRHTPLSTPERRLQILKRRLDEIYLIYLTFKDVNPRLKWSDLPSSSLELLKALLQECFQFSNATENHLNLASSIKAEEEHVKSVKLHAFSEANLGYRDVEEKAHVSDFEKETEASASNGVNGVEVTNLSSSINASRLRREFERFGHITDCTILHTTRAGRPKTFGYVQFADHDDAAKAKVKMHHYMLDGCLLNVNFDGPRDQPVHNRPSTKEESTAWGTDQVSRRYAMPPTPQGGWPEELGIELPSSLRRRPLQQTFTKGSSKLPTFEQVRNQLRGIQISDADNWGLQHVESNEPVGDTVHREDSCGDGWGLSETAQQDTWDIARCQLCGSGQALSNYGDNHISLCNGCGTATDQPLESHDQDSGSVTADHVSPEKSARAANATASAKDTVYKSTEWTTSQDEALIIFRACSPYKSWAAIADELGKTRQECKDRYSPIAAERELDQLPRKGKSKKTRKLERKEERKMQRLAFSKSRATASTAKKVPVKSTTEHDDCNSIVNDKLQDDVPVASVLKNTAADNWGLQSNADVGDGEDAWGVAEPDQDTADFGPAATHYLGAFEEPEPVWFFSSARKDTDDATGWSQDRNDGALEKGQEWGALAEPAHPNPAENAWGCSEACGFCEKARGDNAIPEPATPASKAYTVTYWATVECNGQEVHIPIDSNNVSGPEKEVLDGPAKTVWKWAQEKGLCDKISLRDAFDLAKDVTVAEGEAEGAQMHEGEWQAPTAFTSRTVSPSVPRPASGGWPSPPIWGRRASPSPPPRPWGRDASPTPAPKLRGMSGGGSGYVENPDNLSRPSYSRPYYSRSYGNGESGWGMGQ